MWEFVAFIALGFLIGQLVGLSSASVTTSILGFLFAFGGGSAIGFLKSLQPDERRLASQAIFALSISCMAGVYVGIYVSEHQLLTPKQVIVQRERAGEAAAPSAAARVSVTDRKYLKQNITAAVYAIDQKRANGNLTATQAFDELAVLSSQIGNEAKSLTERRDRGEITADSAYNALYEALAGEEVKP